MLADTAGAAALGTGRGADAPSSRACPRAAGGDSEQLPLTSWADLADAFPALLPVTAQGPVAVTLGSHGLAAALGG